MGRREYRDRSISAGEALQVLQRTVEAEEREAAGDSLPVEMMLLLRAIDDRTAGPDGEHLDDEQAAAIFRLCAEVTRRVEYYERNAMRRMKFEQGAEWMDIAEVHPNLSDKGAAANRWKRYTGEDRRVTTGDFKRGAAVPRPKPAPVVDSTTVADESVSQ